MEVRYNEGMMYPIEIASGSRAICIKLDDAKKLRDDLAWIIKRAEKESTSLDSLPEQPVKGLGDEAESYWIEAGWSKVMTLGRFKTIANHFYELGQQSRPKTSDNSLEEEIDKYLQPIQAWEV